MIPTPTVTPIRRGINRIDDAMLAGHLRRTGHTLVAHRVTKDGIATVHRTCC